MEQEKFTNEMPEEVLLIPNPRRIEISCTQKMRAYALYDTVTGTQVKDFVKCDGGKIEFDNLDPNMHYDVGVIENMGDDKPQFAIMWTGKMRDETDEILKNSNDLPINYPYAYQVIFKDNNSNSTPVSNSVGNSSGVYDLVDENGDTVGQVAQLSGDKPEFAWIRSFRMKDDTIN